MARDKNGRLTKGHIPWLKDKKVDRNKYPNLGHHVPHSKKLKETRSILYKKLGYKPPNWTKGKPKEFFRRMGLKGLISQQNSKEPTSIEKIVYDYLLFKGFLFEKQKLINGKFIVDAYIPNLNLIIECDGDYWHSLDRVIKKDKAENAYLKKCGFNLIRLKETEIRDNSFIERMVV